MATLTVGADKTYKTIGAAIDAANATPGTDDIQIDAGVYQGVENMGKITDSVNIESVGGRVTIKPDPSNPQVLESKGEFIVGDYLNTPLDVTVTGIDFRNATSPYSSNSAGIRFQGNDTRLTLENDGFFNNDEGILANGNAATDVIKINNSEFSGNGYSSQEHNIYIGQIKEFDLTNSYIHGTSSTGAGNEVKSRAANTTITNNRIGDENTTSSWSVDLPNGGNVVMNNNFIEQGPNSENPSMVSYGTEGMAWTSNSFTASGNTFVNDLAPNDNGSPNGILLVNYNNNVSPQFTNNSFYGLTQGQLEAFDDPTKASFTGNTFLNSKPVMDTSSPLTGTSAGGGSTGGGTTGGDTGGHTGGGDTGGSTGGGTTGGHNTGGGGSAGGGDTSGGDTGGTSGGHTGGTTGGGDTTGHGTRGGTTGGHTGGTGGTDTGGTGTGGDGESTSGLPTAQNPLDTSKSGLWTFAENNPGQVDEMDITINKSGSMKVTVFMNGLDPDGTGPKASKDYKTTMTSLNAADKAFVQNYITSSDVTMSDVTKKANSTTYTFMHGDSTDMSSVLGALKA
jgi:hypothetical protein